MSTAAAAASKAAAAAAPKMAKNVRNCLASGKSVSIDIAYDEFFPSKSSTTTKKTTLLLVSGLNATAAMYPSELCQMLADNGGFHVVRYDNRDVGLSTKFDSWGQPFALAPMFPTIPLFGSWIGKQLFSLPYTIEDHAKDGWALLDYLKVDRAALLGSSMGGTIAAAMASSNPDRTLAYIPVQSSTFNPSLSRSPLWVTMQFLRAPPANTNKEELINFKREFLLYTLFPVDSSKPVEQDMTEKRKKHGEFLTRHLNEALDRVSAGGGDPFYKTGALRQMMALLYSDPYKREENLRTIVGGKKIPVLAVGGAGDLLFQPDHQNRFKELCAADVHILPCGHVLTPDDYHPFSQLVSKLLNGDAVKARMQ